MQPFRQHRSFFLSFYQQLFCLDRIALTISSYYTFFFYMRMRWYFYTVVAASTFATYS